MWWILGFVLSFGLGYWLYGKKLENVWKTDIYRTSKADKTADLDLHINIQYLQVAYFASILSFECILSAIMGYLYGFFYVFWWVVGTLFFSGVLAYYGGMYSFRNDGKTICYIIKQKIGVLAHYAVVLLILAVFAMLIGFLLSNFEHINDNSFNLSERLMYLYAFGACVFICFCSPRQFAVIYSGVGIFALLVLGWFVMFSAKYVDSLEYGFGQAAPYYAKYAYPMVMFLCSIGTINCLQGLQSSLFVPLMKNEKMGKKIFFGGAIYLGLFIVLWSMIIQVWNPNVFEYYKKLISSRIVYSVLHNIALVGGGKFAAFALFYLMYALVLTFCGALLRTAKNVIADTGLTKYDFNNALLATVLVLVPAFWLLKYQISLSYIIICTQAIFIFSFVVLILYFKNTQRKIGTLLIPLYFVIGADVIYAAKLFWPKNGRLSYGYGLIISFVLLALHFYWQYKESINQWLGKKLKESYIRNKNSLVLLKRDMAQSKQAKQIVQKDKDVVWDIQTSDDESDKINDITVEIENKINQDIGTPENSQTPAKKKRKRKKQTQA